MKILLVEDDEVIAQTLANILREHHYVVDQVAEGDLGWEFVETYNYDLILLDVILPKLNGIEFCKKLRLEGNKTPVLLLTAQQSPHKKVAGLDAGADDYVVKPFELDELLARIRVLLRRRNFLTSPILQWEKLVLHSSTHKVTYEERELTLTPKEYRLLELFLNNSDRVITREIILDRLWDGSEVPSDNTVCAHMKELRRKLKQAGANADFIQTVYGVGYRLKPLMVDQTPPAKTRKSLQQQTENALASVWQKFKQKNRDRLAILEEASREWRQGSVNPELLSQAQFAAHKLAGGLGLFGIKEGSDLAREMSELLVFKSTSETEQAQYFASLLSTLKQALKPNPKYTPLTLNHHRPTVIAIEQNPQLLQRIMKAMTAAKINFKLVNKPIDLSHVLTQPKLEAILWNFSLLDLESTEIAQIVSKINSPFPLPMLLFTDNDNSSDRLKLASLSRQLFLQPAALNEAQIAQIVQTLKQSQKRVFQVLVIDDDPLVAPAIQTLLSPVKINITSLKHSLDFWRVANQTQPDLIILDVTMPDLSGIELCQLIRNEPRWCKLPILFFTIHHDLATMQQILTAGGNECISKTQTQSILVSKIFHHLDRDRILPNLCL